MAKCTLVVGWTSTGKTTAAEYLDPDKTVIISLLGKDLPFAGWENNYRTRAEKDKKPNFYPVRTGVDVKICLDKLAQSIEGGRQIDNIFIDDGTFAMTNDFMNRINEDSWDKWKDMASAIYFMVDRAKTLPEHLHVFFTWHPETVKTANVIGQTRIEKAQTLGKLFDEKIGGIEPLFTTVLYTWVDHRSANPLEKYYFMTQPIGCTAKTPRGLFGRILIPNNLQYVRDRMDSYATGQVEEWDTDFNNRIYTKLSADGLDLS